MGGPRSENAEIAVTQEKVQTLTDSFDDFKKQDAQDKTEIRDDIRNLRETVIKIMAFFMAIATVLGLLPNLLGIIKAFSK